MDIGLIVWFIIGALANLYLHYKNAAQISAMITSSHTGALTVMLTGMLNHFIWPIALYLHFKDK